MSAFFHAFLYEPIYNLLALFLSVVPRGDIGIAVILVTLAVRTLLMPFSLSALKTQRAMQHIQPKLKEIKELYKNDRERQAKETFAVYREHNTNPFAAVVPLIQIPILIGLYWVFRAKDLSLINTDVLYSFVPLPEYVSTLFLGFFSLATPSIILAILAAAIQYWNARRTMLPPAPRAGTPPSMQEEFTRAMGLQMRYVIPVLIGIAAYTSGAIALYLITSGLFSVAESFMKKQKSVPERASTPAPVGH